MFCPKCKYEYVDGIVECADCHIPLVEKLPNEKKKSHDELKIVPVYATGDPGIIALIKSILESAGIPYFIKGEETQNLFGLGTLGLGYNALLGPMEVWVRTEDKEAAAELLSELG
ncbi:MAG TPA: DUF2007 domain-containing protein [Bacillota bacterium]|nr:DUF2007 domain-containing protein [Bacillota bacterium]